MRLPRDISGDELVKRLQELGYEAVRQSGSHIRLSSSGEHRITIPRHGALKVGTLSGILSDVAEHLGVPKDKVVRRLWR